jgi:predicted N-acetyltransferase YhbS
MTNPLKAAVREALNEIPHCEDIVNDLTSALARRGVVVMTETQKELKNALIDSIDLALHAVMNKKYASPGIKALAEDMHGEIHDLAGILSDEPEIRSATVAEIGPDNCASVAPPEIPTPKPARKVAVRLLEPKDIPALLHIIRANWSEQTAQTAHVEIGQAFSQAVWRPIFYVAELDGIVVGCACYHASWMAWGLYDIAWVNTHPSYQNEGVGRALVSRCINDIRAVGSHVMLTTKIPDYYAKNWGFMPLFDHGGDTYMRLPLSSGYEQ